MRKIPLIAVLATAVLLVACASKDRHDTMSEHDLYMEAQRYLKKDSFELATKDLQLLESRYPFGAYADQAQLELIYSQYRSGQNDAAAATAERFIHLHPQNPDVDYAYYMKGLADYTEGSGFLERFMPTDMTERDPGKTLQSFDDFRQLLDRFPNSNYAPDARARMIYLRARLARHEINVANYYFRRKAYLAAANRGRYVLEHYPQTPAVPDALAVMVQAYQLLGLNHLADSSLEVLRKNFPHSPALDANGNFIQKFNIANNPKHHSWVNILTLGLFDKAEPPEFNNRAPYLKY